MKFSVSQANKFPFSPLKVEIDLGAIRKNFQATKRIAWKSIIAPVIKADAYGLGARQIAAELYNEGSKNFIVATVDEGVNLAIHFQNFKSRPNIYVTDSFPTDRQLSSVLQALLDNQLIPVIANMETFFIWSSYAKEIRAHLPVVLYLNTGFNTKGLSIADIDLLIGDMFSDLQRFNIHFCMSHLANAPDPNDQYNEIQREFFIKGCLKLEGRLGKSLRKSIANSAGILLGDKYHFDIVRPGAALFGLPFINSWERKFSPVISISAYIGEYFKLANNQTYYQIGYNRRVKVKRGSRLVTIGVGYYDGYSRKLAYSKKAKVFISGYRAPVIAGTMDNIVADVSRVPVRIMDKVMRSDRQVEIIGRHQEIGELADQSSNKRGDVIAGEILVAFGRASRARKKYINSSSWKLN